MTNPLTLVINQRAHKTSVLVFDPDGRVRVSSECEVELRGRGTHKVEQDAAEVAASVDQVISEVLADPIVRKLGVARAGLATQRSSVVAWDKRSGRPLAPLLSWQDRRAAEWLRRFNDQAVVVKELTGLRLSPHYGAGKLRWLLDNVPAIATAHKEGYLAFGPLAAYLVSHLIKGKPFLVDHVNASRTQLWNLTSRDWDPWLLNLFNVPHNRLPQCCPVGYEYGRLNAADIPLTAVNGDQNSAIYSLKRPPEGTAVVNIGTGAFILMLTGNRHIPHPALLGGLASSGKKEAEYLVEGTVNGAGAAITWAANRWHIPGITGKLEGWLRHDISPPVFLNTIGGLGSPWWKSEPSPVLLGRECPSAQKAVAVAESILFMIQANLEAMLDAGLTVNRLMVSGNLSQLNGLCQRLADLTQRPVYRPVKTKSTARGIAWLAAGRPEYWPNPGQGHIFGPKPNAPLQERYHAFRAAID